MSKTQEQLTKIITEIEGTESQRTMRLQRSERQLSTKEVIDILLSDSLSQDDNNSGTDLSNETQSQFRYDMKELQHWKDHNNSVYSIPYYRPIDTHTRRFSKVLSFAKRAVRKLCRSLIEPICMDISDFNGSVTASINAIYNNDIVTEAFTNYQLALNRDYEKKLIDIENSNKEKYLNFQKQLEEDYSSIQKKLSKALETLEEKIHTDVNTLYLNSSKDIEELSNAFEALEERVHADVNTLYSDSNKDIYERISQLEDTLLDTKNEFDAALTETELCVFRKLKETAHFYLSAEDRCGTVMEKDDGEVFHQDTYSSLDYFKFENHFRGSRAQTMKNQEWYLKYLSGKGHVLDLGCGRGELLELLKAKGIPATGIDSYGEFVEYCQFKGMDAQLGAVPECLNVFSNESIGAVFAGQLVEHISFDELNKMCQEIYRIMIPGGCLIIETPNPTCLSTYLNAFYIDPSHNKPVHPQTLQYLLQQQGFNNIQIVYTEQSKVGYRLPLLSVPDAENLSEFNDGINLLSDIIFGSQDYAIIAYK